MRTPAGISAAFYVNQRGRVFWLSWTWTKKYCSSRPQDILCWWNRDYSCAAQ